MEFLKVDTVAGQLQVSEATIVRAIKAGHIAATKVGSQWRISQDALSDYLESRTMKVNRRKPQTFKA